MALLEYPTDVKRLGIDLPSSVHAEITQYCSEHQITKTEFIRRAITLLLAVSEKSNEGVGIGFFDKESKAISQEIVLF